VTSQDQAIAIALSEVQKQDGKAPKKRKK